MIMELTRSPCRARDGLLQLVVFQMSGLSLREEPIANPIFAFSSSGTVITPGVAVSPPSD